MVNFQDLFVVDIKVDVKGEPETKKNSKLQSFEERTGVGGVNGGGCFGLEAGGGMMEGCQGDEF